MVFFLKNLLVILHGFIWILPEWPGDQLNLPINLEEIGVNMKVGHTNEIDITKKIKMIMKYATLNDMTDLDVETINSTEIFTMIKRCVYEIRDGETIYNRVDMSEKELEEFIDSLTAEQFEGLTDFFETMPKVQHSVEVTNPKTKKKGEIIIEGIQSFFD